MDEHICIHSSMIGIPLEKIGHRNEEAAAAKKKTDKTHKGNAKENRRKKAEAAQAEDPER